jgi:hypothetical protein
MLSLRSACSILVLFLSPVLPVLISDAQTATNAPMHADTGTPDLSSYSKEALVILSHVSVTRYTEDGTGERVDTMRVKMQSDAAVRALGVLTFPYASSNEHVEVIYVRARKPDGSVVTTSDQDAQDMPSAVTRAAPMYSDTREKQLPVKSLSVGDTLEWQVKVVRTAAESPGQFWYAQSFTFGVVVLDENIELRLPQKKYVQVYSPLFKSEKKDEGDETAYRWHYSRTAPSPLTEDEKKAQVKKLAKLVK